MRETTRVTVGRGLRAFADGFAALLLPLHLTELGFDAFAVGAISTIALTGAAVTSLAVGFTTHLASIRKLLLGAALAMAATGIAFGLAEGFWTVALVAFVGTLNVAGGDSSPFVPLEHATLAADADDKDRTMAFARYGFVGIFAGAIGALAIGLIDVFKIAAESLFYLYAAIGLAIFMLYRGTPDRPPPPDAVRVPLGKSRRHVLTLAALFALDSFGSGLIVQSILALWLLVRFDFSAAETGGVFFVTRLLAAFSQFAAVWLAKHIGLVRTMVFSHLPANLLLIAVPFSDDAATAVGLLVVRSLLTQMDIPVRQSYVMATVEPAERPAAASLTTGPKTLATAVGPVLAGAMLAVSPFGWPFVAAGALKIVYDLTLLGLFANRPPPEEREN